MASASYEAKRNLNEVVAVWTAHISFPAYAGLLAKNFYWSTADQIELEDGNIYVRQLTDIPKGRHQHDRGNDYAEISVSNPDHTLYNQLLPYEDLIEKCSITIREAYEIETDYYHSEIKFKGFLKDFSQTDQGQNLKITATSDMSRSGFPVGNRILTRERCGTEFNINGLISPTISLCGWQTAQGGNPLYCSKRLEGVDGCKAHNNEARFYAINGISTAVVTVVGSGDGGGGDTGWFYNSGSCFDDKVHVLLDDWTTIPINQVTLEHRVMGCSIFEDDKLLSADVWMTFQHKIKDILEVDFDRGVRLHSTKEHEFYIGKGRFKPVGSLGLNRTVGVDGKGKAGRSGLLSTELISGNRSVYNLRTSSENYFVTSENGRFFYLVHNKPPRDEGDIYLPY